MLDSDFISEDQRSIMNDEKVRIEIESASESSLDDEVKMEWAWRSLWEHLKDGRCHAVAVDDLCQIHKIDPYFWTEPVALETLASGILSKIPLYRPNGRVMMSDIDLKKIKSYQYKCGYQAILPSINGLHPAGEDLSYSYAASMMSEAEDIKRNRPGPRAQIDREEYLIAICEVVHSKRVFKSRSELGRLASDVYEKNSPDKRRPAIRTTDPIIEKVWDRLGLSDTPVSEVRRIRSAGE